MTVCAAVNLNDQGICLIADSIVTTTERPATERLIVNEHGEIIEATKEITGITSKGESFQPISKETVTYYSEGACKIARLGPDLFVGFAGNEEFCIRLSEEMVAVNQVIPDGRMEQFLKGSAESVAAKFSISTGTVAEILLAGKSIKNEPLLLRGRLTRANNGIDLQFQNIPPNEVCVIGSGAAELADLPKSPSSFYASKPIPHALPLMAYWFSRKLRERLRNEARGVGGAYFGAGVALTPGESGFMPDMLEIYISKRGGVRVLTKTICRNPGFFVHDYMTALTGIYPIINCVSRFQVKDLIELLPEIFKADFNHLDAHCLIIENDSESLGIPTGQVTLFDRSRFTKLVGWTVDSLNKSKLAIKFPNGQFLTLPREEVRRA